MAFWSFQTLEQRVQEDRIITPYNQAQVQGCAYEMKLGDEVCITSDDTQKKKLSEGEPIKIPSGQFALLITEEKVEMPKDALAFISIKFGIKAQGLINVSGFHVDPGFKGRLKFSVYNAGAQDIILSRGDVVFMIWFCDLTDTDSNANGYDGEHQGQMHITTKDVQLLQGEIVSPGQLRKKLEDVISKKTYNGWVLTLIVSLIIALFLTCLVNAYSNFYKEPSDHIIFKIKETVKSELQKEGWRQNSTLQLETNENILLPESTNLKETRDDSK